MKGKQRPEEFQAPFAYLVIDPQSGIFAVSMDRAKAVERAGNIEGVAVAVPVIADFRNPEQRPAALGPAVRTGEDPWPT